MILTGLSVQGKCHPMGETITLNTEEQKRVMVLNRLLVGHLTAAEAPKHLPAHASRQSLRRIACKLLSFIQCAVKPPHSMHGEDVKVIL